MSGSAKPGQPQTLPIPQPGELEGPVPDCPGTEQRCRLQVREILRDRVGIVFGNHHELGIATIHVTTRGAKLFTYIFITISRRRKDPADSDTVTFMVLSSVLSESRHSTDHLMSRDHRQLWRLNPTLNLIEFRVADTAGRHLDENLTLTGLGLGQLDQFKWSTIPVNGSEPLQHHRLHSLNLFPLFRKASKPSPQQTTS